MPPFPVFTSASRPASTCVAVQGSSTAAIFNALLDLLVGALPPDLERTAQNPIILFVDNHRTHITGANIVKARQLHIVLVGLPENTTNELQPLDKHGFMLVKRVWNRRHLPGLRHGEGG